MEYSKFSGILTSRKALDFTHFIDSCSSTPAKTEAASGGSPYPGWMQLAFCENMGINYRNFSITLFAKSSLACLNILIL